MIRYAHEWLFESTFLVSILLKIKLFSHFDFVRHTSYEIVYVTILCFPPSVKIITNCLMSNFLISLFFSFGLIDYVLRILWSYEHYNKHIAYISMISHFCTDMKVSSLHNLMKKQWLIPLNSTLFCHDWMCKWRIFSINIVSINVVKKSNYILILILFVILLMKLFV